MIKYISKEKYNQNLHYSNRGKWGSEDGRRLATRAGEATNGRYFITTSI